VTSSKSIPVIDIFAGPGGLGEGFSALSTGESRFHLALSIEKNPRAHQTLMLRSFFRKFGRAPDSYYDRIQGHFTTEELYAKYPEETAAAAREAVLHELGTKTRRKTETLVSQALNNESGPWILVGGPPCQTHSLVGRSRMKGADPRGFEKDSRHFLYKEYLHILRAFEPTAFVFENVRGLLSSTVRNKNILAEMMVDFDKLGYALYSFTHSEVDLRGRSLQPSDFLIKAERYGIPQCRHRVIILGLRKGVVRGSRKLQEVADQPSTEDAVSDLPRIRSALSKGDSLSAWRTAVSTAVKRISDRRVRTAASSYLSGGLATDLGSEFMDALPTRSRWLAERDWWFRDERVGGVTLHESRGHMAADLQRYFFASVFAREYQRSANLDDYPSALLPKHKNASSKNRPFNDRFRVQLATRPASTVVSHISKDGHYFIHYDPAQCRSFTVREAARIQTFPDNYFFEGPQTARYHQVGNAVPPLLATQLAEIVGFVLDGAKRTSSANHPGARRR
jgi:DNA (cytosine-5)-methyltransferase 1